MNYIKSVIKQLFCLHKDKEVIDDNRNEMYIEFECCNCGKVIFKDETKKKGLIDFILSHE